jgi:hypothetical protein
MYFEIEIDKLLMNLIETDCQWKIKQEIISSITGLISVSNEYQLQMFNSDELKNIFLNYLPSSLDSFQITYLNSLKNLIFYKDSIHWVIDLINSTEIFQSIFDLTESGDCEIKFSSEKILSLMMEIYQNHITL